VFIGYWISEFGEDLTEMVGYHLSLGERERLVARSAADTSSEESDIFRREIIKEMEDYRMNARVDISKKWALSAEKDVPERFVEFQEVLALSETLVKVKDKKFDGCGFCGKKFGGRCREATKCRVCSCGPEFERYCLRD